jgi:hypothetical protein
MARVSWDRGDVARAHQDLAAENSRACVFDSSLAIHKSRVGCQNTQKTTSHPGMKYICKSHPSHAAQMLVWVSTGQSRRAAGPTSNSIDSNGNKMGWL